MGADGDHDVPEVNGGDFSSLGTVSLHKGLLRMLQLYFLQLEKVKQLCLLLSSCKWMLVFKSDKRNKPTVSFERKNVSQIGEYKLEKVYSTLNLTPTGIRARHGGTCL